MSVTSAYQGHAGLNVLTSKTWYLININYSKTHVKYHTIFYLVKAVPCQAWSGPECSRQLRFHTIIIVLIIALCVL